MLVKWLAALAVTGAACTAAGIALDKKYCHSSSSKATASSEKTTDQVIEELQTEIERQKKLRAQERTGRTNAERVRVATEMWIALRVALPTARLHP